MRSALLFFLLFFSILASAQTAAPSVDIFGGYSYLNIDTNGLTTSRQSANGWEASVSVGLWKYLAAEGDFAGYYKNNVLGTGVNARDYEFSGGPRFDYRYVFGHALFGTDRLSGSVAGTSASQNSFVVILGGGIQYPVAPHLAVRGSADWGLTHHNILGGPRVDQNNFRAAGGIVFTFGKRNRGAEANAEGPRSCGTNGPPTLSMTLANVGLTGDSLSVYGFHVTAISPGSAAEKSGLLVDDYIVSVNCVPVKNADDLLAALSRATGTALVEITKPTWFPNHREVRRLDVGGQR